MLISVKSLADIEAIEKDNAHTRMPVLLQEMQALQPYML